MALSIDLDRTVDRPLFLQIAERVRTAIAKGLIGPGARLPSSRALAAQLAVARGTVDAAYELLAGEGAITARRAGGTIVSGAHPVLPLEPTPYMFTTPVATACTAPLLFRVGLPALDAFPRKLWSSLTVHAVRAAGTSDMADPDPAGLLPLRHEIAAYLGIARGIRCSAANVLVTAGYQGALALVRQVLLARGDPVWMEDPGYFMTRQALEAAGARVVPVRVDGEGMRVASGMSAAPRAKLAVVTPTHQCPTGVALSLPRRLELLGWAAANGSWVLEDDYDSEFRYTGRPLPSLKSLDRGQRVLYAGSFSKTLFPALRLGYLVVPPELMDAFLRAVRLGSGGQPMLEQRVVATFLQKGHFGRHIKRMRTIYAERRQALVQALRDVLGSACEIEMASGGMHLLLRFPHGPDDAVLARRAAAAGLAPTPLSSLTITHGTGVPALLLGFTNIPPETAAAAARRLKDAIDAA